MTKLRQQMIEAMRQRGYALPKAREVDHD